jgi:hypothetical protein
MNRSAWVLMVLLTLPASAAWGQVPFYSSGATGYEAVISSTFSGPALGVTATVSPDHKYATLGMQATLAGTPSFTPFSITTPVAAGFVGSGGGSTPSAAGILDRPGMTLILPLQP